MQIALRQVDAKTVQWLIGAFKAPDASNAADRALLPLVDQPNQTGTVYPGTSLRFVCEMADTSSLKGVT